MTDKPSNHRKGMFDFDVEMFEIKKLFSELFSDQNKKEFSID